MKSLKLFFLLLLTMVSSSIFSQDRDTRKGHLFLKVGTEYRITPIYNGIDYSDIRTYTNIDKQNSGFAFNYGVDYFVTRDLSLGFTHGFHYTLLNSDNYHPEDFGLVASKHRILFDFHLYLDYHFKVFKKNELFVRLGISLLNRNSNYNTKESFYDNQGNYIGNVVSEADYTYEPNNIALGYKTKKLEFMLGVYTTNNVSEYAEVLKTFTVPYFKLHFNVFKF